MGLEYSAEKLWTAIGSMASSQRSLQDRLYDAYQSFHPIRPDEDLSTDELREAYADIKKRLTADKSDSNRGYLRTTLDGMSTEDASRLIDDIVALAHMVEMERTDMVRSLDRQNP